MPILRIRRRAEAAPSGMAARPSRHTKARWLAAGIFAIVLAWVGIDLYGPRRTNIRDFDPDEVARLETAMWRSYYDRQRLLLFSQLAELLRTQYRFPFLRSHLVAYHAAQAAFVFKDGRTRADYEQALPPLEKFYGAIRGVSDLPFDARRAARLELEWWIVHRERAQHRPGDLEGGLAESSAELYGLPVEPLMEHGRLRAEAMTIRDQKAEGGGLTEADWGKIHELLRASWQSLWRAVNHRSGHFA